MSEVNNENVRAYTSRISRRNFLTASGGGAPLSASMATALFFAQSKAHAQGRWDHEADVVVVGTGAAGSASALFASEGNSKVLLVEKGVTYGGTTGISAGVFHIPNNALMRSAGIADPREDAIRYYCRTAYPAMYS